MWCTTRRHWSGLYRLTADIAWCVVAADIDPRLDLERMVTRLGADDWMQTRRALELVLDVVCVDHPATKHFQALDRAWSALSRWNEREPI